MGLEYSKADQAPVSKDQLGSGKLSHDGSRFASGVSQARGISSSMASQLGAHDQSSKKQDTTIYSTIIKPPIKSHHDIEAQRFLMIGKDSLDTEVMIDVDISESGSVSFKKTPIPHKLPSFKGMGILFISEDFILLTGGLGNNNTFVSNGAVRYNHKTGEVKKLPSMITSRYHHAVTYFNEQLYVLGGRTYGALPDCLLTQCEMLDISNEKWVSIPPMVYKRSCFSALVYQGKIFAFGGYTKEKKRTRKIEYFDPEMNIWCIYHLKLYYGLEGAAFIAGGNDELLVLGGRARGGDVRHALLYNLRRGTLESRNVMNYSRCLFPFTVKNNAIFVFGGDEMGKERTFEKCNLDEGLWMGFSGAHAGEIKAHRNFREFSFSLAPMEIKSELSSGWDNKAKSEKMVENEITGVEINPKCLYLFGHQGDPFIIEIKEDSFEARRLPVPINLVLASHSRAVRLGERLLITGGVRMVAKKVVNTVVELGNGKLNYLKSMPTGLYSHGAVYYNGYILVMGGKNANNLPSKECYALHLNHQVHWEKLSPLNKTRWSFFTFASNNFVYAGGGFSNEAPKTELRWAEIESYDFMSRSWVIISATLPYPLESPACLYFPHHDQVMLLGGRTPKGNSSDILLGIVKGPDKIQFLKCGNMKKTRVLHQALFQRKTNSVIVFGGSGHTDIESISTTPKVESVFNETLASLSNVFSTTVLEKELKNGLAI